jgi:hypothetical protein
MDYGQSLQVPQQMPTNFSSAQNITMNPLLNYGQTPLTMASGGITRLGYQEGGMDQMQDPMMQQAPEGIMNAMPQQMTEPPLQGMEGQQPDIKDPKKALEIIIQMLIAQGIPPEQAKEIALQMVQAVAQGGMGEMSDQRIGARFGGMMNNGRENYGFGSFFSGIGKAIGSVAKGVTNAVSSVVKSPIGKAALTIAAIYATGGGAAFGGPGFASAGTLFGPGGTLGGASGLFGAADLVGGTQTFSPGLLGFGGEFAPMSGSLFSGISGLMPTGVGDLVSKYGTSALISGAAGALGGALAGGMPQQQPGESDADYQNRVNQYKLLYQQGVSNPTLSTGINPSNLYPNNPFYAQRRAEGGRMGYADGTLIGSNITGKPGGISDADLQKNYTLASPPGTFNSIYERKIGLFSNPDGSYPTDSIKPSVGGFGMNLMGKLIQQNPEMFNPVQSSNGIADLVKKTTKQTYFGNVTPMYNYNLQDLSNIREENDNYTYAANGGRMGYAMGAEVPTRENQAGVTELDYRKKGGFVPPIGIKEKADDIPAMLSNNEFVFTANAVRNAGRGDVNKGAKRMYGLMKQLEAGGMA